MRMEHGNTNCLKRAAGAVIALGVLTAACGLAVLSWSPLAISRSVEASDGAGGASGLGAFAPTIANKNAAPSPAPTGMVWIPGGEFSMGAMDPPAVSEAGMHGAVDARPIHRVYVDAFWMDKTDVTNEEFARFVKATSYETVAERAPTAEEFPGAPPENLVAGSVVFSAPDHLVPLNNHFQWWTYVKGANWRHPEGPQSNIKGREKSPVVQVAYPDAPSGGQALAYRSEWEFAARGGLAGQRYPWGDEFSPSAVVVLTSGGFDEIPRGLRRIPFV